MTRAPCVALALLAGLLLQARAQSSDGINACVLNAGGRVRIVGSASQCKRKEHPLAWAVAGPQGVPGPPGPSGSPPCRVVGRFTIAGIPGDGPGGTMSVYAYHVVLEPGAPGGGPTIIDFSITKPIDSVSPALAQAALQGTPATTARLELFRADGITIVTTYDLTTVPVAGFSTGTTAACLTGLPTDTLSFSFAGLVVSS